MATKKNAPNFLNDDNLEVLNPMYAEIYKNMQGNILKGHGRDHATMIFLKFVNKNENDLKAYFKYFAETYVTSFYKQLWERERYKRNKVPGNTFGAVFFSKNGYAKLEAGKDMLNDEPFKEGMKKRGNTLNDKEIKGHPETNFEDWHTGNIDAMLLLADDDKTRMDKLVGEIIEPTKEDAKKLKSVAVIVHIEYGDAIRNSNHDGLEHNGYVDGVSQPLFLKDEIDEYKKHHGITEEDFKFDPTAQPGLVLLQDPYTKKTNSYGSYFVYRKLEQNVRGFKRQESEIGKALYGQVEESERSGAEIVGRFEDGTPINIQGEDKLIGSGAFNNFNYDDPSDGKCPHFAHIRKTNPREKVNDKYKFDDHTMARRGIPFGHRNVDTEIDNIQPEQFPKKGVGLLFMSYQKSIESQFEFIQQAANTNNSIGKAGFPDGGVDPVIGIADFTTKQNAHDRRTAYKFVKDADVITNKLEHDFDQHIHFKGGEYFFAPSISYLLQ